MSPLADISSSFAPRFAEFAFEPAFTAAVDQHVAEIRDRLSAGGPSLEPPPPHPEDLTDYALGFLDALTELDWREPVGHDYAVCRLTAISWLVRRHGLLDGNGAFPDACGDGTVRDDHEGREGRESQGR
ncbi:DUF6401 family natural product biosynthesis protein [Streptomyces calvus]|jgi:hypothetical protein|uniref:DUF6401 family natural product biosynthesis protein n=1 Tax=Streptomyces calvus TaxID=67282 RepID=UPI002D76E788|nr:DUF6401 family natural product biosynthesis protein [Streptomyces calvus]